MKATTSKTVHYYMKTMVSMKVAVKTLTARMWFAARDRKETAQHIHLMYQAHMK